MNAWSSSARLVITSGLLADLVGMPETYRVAAWRIERDPAAGDLLVVDVVPRDDADDASRLSKSTPEPQHVVVGLMRSADDVVGYQMVVPRGAQGAHP